MNNLGSLQPVLSQPHSSLNGNLDTCPLEATKSHVSSPPQTQATSCHFPWSLDNLHYKLRQTQATHLKLPIQPTLPPQLIPSQSSCCSHHELGQLLISYLQPAQLVALTRHMHNLVCSSSCSLLYVCPLTYQLLFCGRWG